MSCMWVIVKEEKKGRKIHDTSLSWQLLFDNRNITKVEDGAIKSWEVLTKLS